MKHLGSRVETRTGPWLLKKEKQKKEEKKKRFWCGEFLKGKRSMEDALLTPSEGTAGRQNRNTDTRYRSGRKYFVQEQFIDLPRTRQHTPEYDSNKRQQEGAWPHQRKRHSPVESP